MDQEQTLTLYKQGVEAWNKWANERLEEKKRLVKAGKWIIERNENYDLVSKNEETQTWLKKSEANFTTKNVAIHFNEIIDFTDFIFPSYVCFNSATFDNNCIFVNVNFFGDVDFIHTEFNGLSLFEKTNFYGHVNFDSSKFNDETSFAKAKFHQYTCMRNINFNDITCFDETLFLEDISFNCSIFLKSTRFKNVRFLKESDLAAMKVKSSFSLENSIFQSQIPELIQASFTEAPRLDNIKLESRVPPGNFINSIISYIHPDIKASYQALKRLAVQAHDHENEQRFWAGELRSDRSLRTEDGGWNLRPLVSAFWWGNIAYGFFSDYGRSIVRPLGTLLVLVILMTGLHLSISKKPLTYENTFSAGYISASKSIFNLGADPTKRSILKEKYSALYGVTEKQTPNIPKSILIAEMGQTLLSAIFIFLTLLGVRNNFKMK